MAYFNYNRGGEVQYNLGSTQLQNIGSSMDSGSLAFKKQEPMKWFLNTKAIKLTIISRLTKEERERLHGMELKIKAYFKHLRKVGLDQPDDNDKINSFVTDRVGDLIEEYDTAIKEYLETKGFLVPTKRDRTNIFENPDDDLE